MFTHTYKQTDRHRYTDTLKLANPRNTPWCLLGDHRAYKLFSRSKTLFKLESLFGLNLFISFWITHNFTANKKPDKTVFWIGFVVYETTDFSFLVCCHWRFGFITCMLMWAPVCILPLWVTKCLLTIWDSGIWRWMDTWSDSCGTVGDSCYRLSMATQSPPSDCLPFWLSCLWDHNDDKDKPVNSSIQHHRGLFYGTMKVRDEA